MPLSLRKLVLFVHVVTSVGFAGAVAAFLVLAVAGLNGLPSAYLALPLVTWWVIVPCAVAALAVGTVSGLGTPWGLLKHYWVSIKLILTAVALVVLLLKTQTIGALAVMAANGAIGPASSQGQYAMVLHSAGGLAVLLLAAALSTYKPRGLTGLRL
jgi:hypothetical protein